MVYAGLCTKNHSGHGIHLMCYPLFGPHLGRMGASLRKQRDVEMLPQRTVFCCPPYLLPAICGSSSKRTVCSKRQWSHSHIPPSHNCVKPNVRSRRVSARFDACVYCFLFVCTLKATLEVPTWQRSEAIHLWLRVGSPRGSQTTSLHHSSSGFACCQPNLRSWLRSVSIHPLCSTSFELTMHERSLRT